MATNENEIPFTEVKTLADGLLTNATDAMTSLLSHVAELQQARANLMAAEADRLKTTLGADHPRVLALSQAATAAGVFKATLNTEAVRASRRPAVGPNEWLVYGRVYDEQGNPMPGLHVRVFDRDRKYDDLLGETTTDEYGDFSVKYHERDFAEIGEAQPDLYVMVSDAAGTALYSSRDNVRYESGRSEYFEVVLGAAPESTGGKTKTTTSKTRRAARKRVAE